MLTINIITLFPNLFKENLETLPLKKAIQLSKVKVNLINLRGFGKGVHKKVDAKPFGGGVGMILQIEPIYNALESINAIKPRNSKTKTILLSPKGAKLTQSKVIELSQLDQINFICGRYEGIDNRIEENFVDEVLSIGDYVLSGGELPALVTLEAITRVLPGVLEKEEASKIESFSEKNTLEYPQYSRPEEFKGLKVPEILISGHHKKIEEWKKSKTKKV